MSASPLEQTVGRAPALPPPRAYGQSLADLDLDFGQQNRLALVTTVLARCCKGTNQPDETLIDGMWSLPIGARIVRLLRVVSLTTRMDKLTMALVCSHNDCGKTFEVSPAFSDLLADSSEESYANKVVQFPLDNASSLTLRLPTGRDQATWRNQTYPTPDEAMLTIVKSLVTGSAEGIDVTLPQKIGDLSTILEEADPLTSFHIDTTCPHCGRTVDIAVDLEAVALTRLALHRRSLLRDVHAFATHYGWSETEVLAIPTERRAEYRRLISAEEDTLP